MFGGVGVSGSPMPSEMTSMPGGLLLCDLALELARTGTAGCARGARVGFMPPPPAQRTNSSENSPSKTGSAQPVSVTSSSSPTADLELAAVELDGHRAASRRAAPPPRRRRMRRSRTRASPPPRARRSARARGPRPSTLDERHVRAVREQLAVARSAGRCGRGRGRSSSSPTSITHCGLPMLTCWNSNSRPSAIDRAAAVLAAGGEVRRAQPRAAHLDRCRCASRGDRRPDLAGGRLDRELVARRSSPSRRR